MYKFRVGKYISSSFYRSAAEAREAAIAWVNNFVAGVIPVSAVKVFRV